MGTLHLGFYSDSESARPYKEAIEHAAAETSLSPHLAALVISHFIDGLTTQLVRGHVVTIPGFGLFAPVLYVPQKRRRVAKDRPRCKPVFSPSLGLVQMVRYSAPVSDVGAKRYKRYYLRNYASSRPDRETARTVTAQAKFRTDIKKQIAGMIP